MDGAAAATTVADVRAYLRGDVINPEPGTLAYDVEEHVRAETALATVVSVAACILAGLVLLVMSGAARAQTIDAWKPRAIPTTPIAGLYVDQSSPGRYCVFEAGQFGHFGTQTFIHCAAGFNSAGHTFAQGVQVGREYLLYRLAGDTLLAPVVLTSVTITEVQHGLIRVRFGSPGAQTPTYTLTLQ
jgi:hypothetical protein